MSWAWLLLLAHSLIALYCVHHILLNKREPRAAIGWIAVCVAYPFLGAMLYSLFGINRVSTLAKALKADAQSGDPGRPVERELSCYFDTPQLAALVQSSSAVTMRPMTAGNAITPYFDGESAYAAMLEAIDRAQHTVYLASYIFDSDQTGERFVATLAAAQRRGVRVRVLVDGVGEWYSWPRISASLRKAGLSVSRFLPPRLFPPMLHVNLRNHRKLLLVDGQTAFTGGMNIGDRQLSLKPDGKPGSNDIHFCLRGPVIGQFQRVFEEDWYFSRGEDTEFQPAAGPVAGGAVCRAITDGPNEDLGKLEMIITGAIALARHRVRIMTPYFLPEVGIMRAMQAAALRGVEVSLILPAQNNLPFVDWAMRHVLDELLACGVNVYYQPPPFAHTKFLLIDDVYALIGSANLDARSLRLNFELVVEVFDEKFVARLAEHFAEVKAQSASLTLADLQGRSMPAKLRDAAVWLFSPYL
ncbi:phospholipase D-like domain-containing protein [Granulosicoccaceae sp. 1_MG-2023]|nr:phospholipase D-like domain-containing protein [Granulosicoccaceae sp. 1_MG-2023]